MNLSPVKLIRIITAIGSLCLFAVSVWQLSSSSVGRIFIEKTNAELRESLIKLAERNADQTRLERAISDELARAPRDWIVINSLLEVAASREIPISDDIYRAVETANATDHSFLNTARACAECAWDAGTCQTSQAMACGMTISMTPVGDFAGLARAGRDYWTGADIDEIDAALSAIGIGATAMSIGTGGTSLTIKAGAGFLRFAHRSGNIPAPITRVLRQAARDGIDWSGLRSVRGAEDVQALIRADQLSPAVEAASSIGSVVTSTSVAQGLHLLRVSESVSDMRSIAPVAAVWEDETAGFVRLAGKNRVVRATLKLADGVLAFVLGLFGLLISIFWTAISLRTNRLAKRLRTWDDDVSRNRQV